MRNLLLSSATLLLVPAVSMAAPDFPSHTHTDTPVGLEPISDLSSSLKLAAVCFLGAGDCGDAGFNTVGGEDYTRPTSELCIEAGYATTSCVCRIIFTTAARTTTPIIGAVVKTKRVPARKPVTFFPATTDIF